VTTRTSGARWCENGECIKYDVTASRNSPKSEHNTCDLCVVVAKTIITHGAPCTVVVDLKTSRIRWSVITSKSHRHYTHRTMTSVRSTHTNAVGEGLSGKRSSLRRGRDAEGVEVTCARGIEVRDAEGVQKGGKWGGSSPSSTD